MFKSSYNKGFSMTFKNGLTISVQWGVGNYCERRSFHHTHIDDMKNIDNWSPDAEIAIWSTVDGKDLVFTLDFGNDSVKGFVSADEVAHWIYITMSAINLNHVAHMAREYHGLMPKLEEKYVYPSTYKPE